jgi:PPP family 3-phenylpropionic acid transporter
MRFERDAVALRGLYFGYLGANGLMATYWAWYLSSVGLTGTQIGLLFGVRSIITVVAQPVLATVADRLGMPIRLLKVGLLSGTLCIAGLSFMDSFRTIAGMFWLASPALAVVIPLVDATVVVRYGSERYGGFRLWGSLGYGIVVAIFGWAVTHVPYAEAGALAVQATVVAFALTTLCAVMLRRDAARPTLSVARPAIRVSMPLVTFFAVNAVHWSAVMIYNIYLGKLVEARGWATSVPGYAVAAAILAEVLALAIAARLLARFEATRWFAAIALVSALRWGLCVWAPSASVLIAVQLLHLLSFGVWIAATMETLGRFGPPDRRPTLQGWFSGAVLAAGGFVGSALGGAMLDLSGADGVFYAAMALDLIATLGFVAFRRTWLPSEPMSPIR